MRVRKQAFRQPEGILKDAEREPLARQEELSNSASRLAVRALWDAASVRRVPRAGSHRLIFQPKFHRLRRGPREPHPPPRLDGWGRMKERAKRMAEPPAEEARQDLILRLAEEAQLPGLGSAAVRRDR